MVVGKYKVPRCYGVLTSSGYHSDLITTLNKRDLSAKGYMQSPNDWKNVEMTGYSKVNAFTKTNNWHRMLHYTDKGNWGGGYPDCGATNTQVITWGGPIAVFRWDNIDDMDVKNFSIREIQPPS